MMKNLFLLLFVAMTTMPILGQSIIDKHYQPLENNMDATVVFVSGNLFGYVAKVMPDEKEDTEKIKSIMEGIESFKLISMPGLSNPVAEYKKGLPTLRATHDELLTVRDKDNNFAFFIDEEEDVIRELVGIGTTDNTFVVFSLLGELALDDIAEITEMIQDKQELPISMARSKSITDFKVYPNPIAKSTMLNVDVPEDMIGGTISIIDMSGKIVQTASASGNRVELSIQDASLGNYIVDITNGDVTLKKQVIVIE